MKKVILFSRNDLVNLYGGIGQHLIGAINIVHLAYSKEEEQILRERYNVVDIINFKGEISQLIGQEQIDLDLIHQIDQLIIDQTNNRFCLNSCIQSDRTFANMDYNEILILVQVYYKFWNNLIEKLRFDCLLHEPVALFFLQIASVICKKHGAEYLTQIQVFGETKYNWIFVSADSGFSIEMPKALAEIDSSDEDKHKRAEKFLDNFRKDFELILPELASKDRNSGTANVFGFWLKIIKTIAKHIFNKRENKQEGSDPENALERYLSRNKSRLSDRLKNLWDEQFYLRYDNFDPNKDYYYYPMHMEPEAVVLYWGDGIYKNQIKLIENIAAQLPPNSFLYVKVHPIVKEERHFIDYKRVRAIPNVKLLGSAVSGKLIISQCKGLLTINGTSGFEAVLLNKPVYVFGNSFYDLSNRVFKIKNIRDLREVLYQNHNQVLKDDESLYRFVLAYLQISHPGYTAYYSNYRELLKIGHNKNVEEVSIGIKEYFT
ncbi:MAG: hypothetical protein HXX16_00960 [Bacteroidales bacterium]|nr:hypothetical protein [Bacteroidales bacterium]